MESTTYVLQVASSEFALGWVECVVAMMVNGPVLETMAYLTFSKIKRWDHCRGLRGDCEIAGQREALYACDGGESWHQELGSSVRTFT
jgi:hypothetical protein